MCSSAYNIESAIQVILAFPNFIFIISELLPIVDTPKLTMV